MNPIITGNLRSKTSWAAILLMALGGLEQSGLLALIPDDYKGIAISAVGALMLFLRNITTQAVTNKSVEQGPGSAQGGFARPLMLALIAAITLLTLLLQGCATLGVPAPQTFNERLAAGYVSATSIRTSATTLLNGAVITSSDAENLQKQADVAREGLDVARTLPALQAEDKLQATLLILQAAQTYLCGKNPNDPNCTRTTP